MTLSDKDAGSVIMQYSYWPHWPAVGARGWLPCHSSHVTGVPQVRSSKLLLFPQPEWLLSRQSCQCYVGRRKQRKCWGGKLSDLATVSSVHFVPTNQSLCTIKYPDEHIQWCFLYIFFNWKGGGWPKISRRMWSRYWLMHNPKIMRMSCAYRHNNIK